MEAQKIQVERRDTRGKGAARQLRMRGQLPGVLYGPKVEATSLTLSPKELLGALSTPYRRNAILSLAVDGQEHLAMVQDLDLHPVTKQPIHVDFYRVAEDQSLRLMIPFTTSGRSVGVQLGGTLRVMFRSLPVHCLPDRIPAAINVDVTSLELHQAISVADLELPDGVIVDLPAKQSLVLVAEERRAKKDESEEQADGAAAAGEGEAAAAAKS